MKLQSNINSTIDQIISLYLNSVNRSFPHLLEGFYLYGSIALGDYSLELSDIDFIAVTKERLHDAEVAILNQVHREIESKYKKPNLNGIYLTWSDLGKLPENTQPFPYFCDGVMHRSGYFELNLVPWYELKVHGIRIIGPDISTLEIEVDFEQLLSSMHQNLNEYWKNWIRKSSKRFSLASLALYFRRADIEWGVLGITRLYYTFREQQITSKAGAGEYALKVVPARWHRVIQECIHTRRGEAKSLYVSKIQRKKDALGYMNYMMSESNKIFNSIINKRCEK
ncbi:conserved hypothetical protein [Paenibacillus curdlanolyticus YK9]|uniref:Adenylyltransferase AadA C-terminal domain-containing protein n=1 Tax=Paenibacillus curdlanolyticus YK9 TaxID=717606 RepID=E0IA64_9BACL|nr:nucleotidyltransferase domain-containing protein [Paenibacillus curdlanolyticus]EFM10641.1 conserved hypothetical protein [Paenibacillus curdlanolyticus YK9]